MKKDLHFLSLTTLIAILTGLVPLYLKWNKDRDLRALIARPPAAATRVMRKAISGATEVRIYKDLIDSYEPSYFNHEVLAERQKHKPTLLLNGKELDEFIKALHAEGAGYSAWKPFNQTSIPTSIEICTALEFYRGDKWLADIRLGKTYGFRWWGPPRYKADAPALSETWKYLERIGII